MSRFKIYCNGEWYRIKDTQHPLRDIPTSKFAKNTLELYNKLSGDKPPKMKEITLEELQARATLNGELNEIR